MAYSANLQLFNYLAIGFEYTVEATFGGYGPVEKTYHLCRRRRWVRNRVLVTDAKMEQEQVSGKSAFSATYGQKIVFTASCFSM